MMIGCRVMILWGNLIMNEWMIVWSMLLVVVLILFGVVMFFVVIGGMKDFCVMLKEICDLE